MGGMTGADPALSQSANNRGDKSQKVDLSTDAYLAVKLLTAISIANS